MSTIVACIPVSHHPTEPTDQSTPITKEPCPQCGEEMWVSAKKRQLRDVGFDCVCMPCIIRSDMRDGTLRELVDIGSTS